MRATRFVFVQGIVGAGKSTTALSLAKHMRRYGVPNRFLPEGPTCEAPAHPLRVGPELPHPQAVWRDLTVEQYATRSLAKRAAFVSEARAAEMVRVCDGLLFHGNTTDLFLMDADPPFLQRYVDQVIAHLTPLAPVLVYFPQADVARALRRICDQRGSAWEAYQVDWKVASPFAANRALQGFDGLMRLYQAYCRLFDNLVARLAVPTFAIRHDGDWEAAYRAISAFLGLPPDPPLPDRTAP